MLINSNVQSIMKLYGEQKSVKKTETKDLKTDKKDEFVLSTQAKQFSQYLSELNQKSAIRQDKIDKIAQQIDSGQYNIDSLSVAEKMLSYKY